MARCWIRRISIRRAHSLEEVFVAVVVMDDSRWWWQWLIMVCEWAGDTLFCGGGRDFSLISLSRISICHQERPQAFTFPNLIVQGTVQGIIQVVGSMGGLRSRAHGFRPIMPVGDLGRSMSQPACHALQAVPLSHEGVDQVVTAFSLSLSPSERERSETGAG